ncbi:MAG TPA: alpha/beta hydrolase [Steroidobacteraceae bacterium]|nr:alpha/beta hydrolase [Steroidobacteraceae bacterium]
MTSPARGRSRPWIGALLILLTAILSGACSRDKDKETAAEQVTAAVQDGVPLSVSSEDGVPIRYRVYGTGEPALILIHCWACDSSYWDQQLDALKARYTLVTLDLAGHGESGTTRGDWSIAAFGADVAAVASRILNDQIVLVGHSMGGPVALEAARRLSGRVIGIIGVDTFTNIGLQPLSPRELELRLEPYRSDFAATTRANVTQRFFKPNSDPNLVRRIADDMASEPPVIGVGAMIGMNNMNYAAALGDINVPIIAINSDRLPTDVDRIRLHAPTFSVKLMPGTGHFLMIEEAPRFNALLDQTVQELLGANPGARP